MRKSPTTGEKKFERAAIAVCVVLTLAACSTSPRTELSWNVRQHNTVPGNTYYGPSSVKLPPVERKSAPPAAPQRQAAVPTPRPRPTPGWYGRPAAQPAPYTDDTAPAQRYAGDGVRFRWPLAGRIVLDYGGYSSGERNDGINIEAAPGAVIHAAAAGTVSYCGNELRGYGNLILIQHDGGYLTAYAHVASIAVNRGDRVAAGQAIATAGATGDVASPQLHFEIRRDKHPVDPKALLPKGMMVASN